MDVDITKDCAVSPSPRSPANSPSMGLNHEANRLDTFRNWPIQSPVDGSRLAKAGFYYSGESDKVTCFSCKGEIRDWQFGDSPMQKHKSLFPHCDFVNNRSNNVHLANFSLPRKPSLGSSEASKETCNGVANGHSHSNGTTRPSTTNGHPLDHIDIEEMKDEVARRATFEKGKWAVPFIHPDDLAKAGFFYEGNKDRVKCAFCFGVLFSWTPGDDPFALHASKFPFCPMMLGKEKGRPATRHGLPFLPGQNGITRSYDVCGMYDTQSVPENGHKPLSPEVQKLGIKIHKGPKYQDMAALAARLKTFSSWPSHLPVKPKDLAEAGFYYIGMGDATKCFYCDGGLQEWKAEDNPWREHARWFPHCGFLRLNKSDEFILSCAPPEQKKEEEKQTVTVPKKMAQAVFASNSRLSTTGLERCATYPPGRYATSQSTIPEIKLNTMANGLRRGSCVENRRSSTPGNEVQTQLPAKSETANTERHQANEEGQFLCKLCLEREVGVVFLPCGHLLACTMCAPGLRDCPICRRVIQGTVRTFLS